MFISLVLYSCYSIFHCTLLCSLRRARLLGPDAKRVGRIGDRRRLGARQVLDGPRCHAQQERAVSAWYQVCLLLFL